VTAQTTPKYLGLSSDLRTNRWCIACPACGKTFEPQTTMFRQQGLQCPHARCGKQMIADYENDVVTLRESF
jgi:DNA-directed RNA polymerase subunit RPC12/RpoP